jgi:hypothetical protein
VGSKNKSKVSAAALGPSAVLHNASPSAPPKTFSFFCIAGAQCREIQRVPLKFTKFMDGRELREAILDAGRMTTQLGTPRGRYDEHSRKFSLSKKPRFIDPVRKSQYFRR